MKDQNASDIYNGLLMTIIVKYSLNVEYCFAMNIWRMLEVGKKQEQARYVHSQSPYFESLQGR